MFASVLTCGSVVGVVGLLKSGVHAVIHCGSLVTRPNVTILMVQKKNKIITQDIKTAELASCHLKEKFAIAM